MPQVLRTADGQAHIMPCLVVAGPRVAQANQQPHVLALCFQELL